MQAAAGDDDAAASLTPHPSLQTAFPPKPTTAAATAGTWDFFPHNVHLNCTDFGDCSTPSAWSLANQTAYAAELPSSDALVGGGAGLLTIAVHTYNAGEATLYFQPGAWCDTVGAAIPLEVMQGLIEGTPPPSRRRALLLARGASGGSGRIASRAMLQAAEVVDTATPVAGPPPAEFEVSRACGVAQVAYAVDGGGAATPLPVFNEQAGVYKLELPAGLPDVSTRMAAWRLHDGASAPANLGPRHARMHSMHAAPSSCLHPLLPLVNRSNPQTHTCAGRALPHDHRDVCHRPRLFRDDARLRGGARRRAARHPSREPHRLRVSAWGGLRPPFLLAACRPDSEDHLNFTTLLDHLSSNKPQAQGQLAGRRHRRL